MFYFELVGTSNYQSSNYRGSTVLSCYLKILNVKTYCQRGYSTSYRGFKLATSTLVLSVGEYLLTSSPSLAYVRQFLINKVTKTKELYIESVL